MFKDIGTVSSSLYGNWETKELEPKSSGEDIITALSDGYISISDIYEVIQAPGFMLWFCYIFLWYKYIIEILDRFRLLKLIILEVKNDN